MELNRNQYRFLVEVSKQNGKQCMSELGRRVYCTPVSVYTNMKLLRGMGLITISRKRNKIIPKLTERGMGAVNAYFEVTKSL